MEKHTIKWNSSYLLKQATDSLSSPQLSPSTVQPQVEAKYHELFQSIQIHALKFHRLLADSETKANTTNA
jgi:hypothetical protein